MPASFLIDAEIHWLTATEIARRVRSGELSAASVIEAHINRIEAVNGRLNAVVVKTFDRARHEAAQVDTARAQGAPLGPLAGVPVTIKECFHVAGTPATLGLKRHLHDLDAVDSPLVRRWTAAGAIVLGKTNVPQLMVLHETDNPLYGRTNNPWNLQRAPGGSSGGEAAIIAAGGSPLGLASDLGGSIRQPAHSCGVAGLLPTFGRIEVTGKRGNFSGMEALSLQPGPLARSVDDLELAYQVLADPTAASCQARIAPTEFHGSRSVEVSQLRIGWLHDDGYFNAAPALRRAVDEAAAALRNAGATVEPFALEDMAQAVDIYFGLITADGGANLTRTLGPDVPDYRIRRLLRMARVGGRARQALSVLAGFAGEKALSRLLAASGPISADRYWQLAVARDRFTEQTLAALAAQRFDALILPPHALPALTHGSTIHPPLAASYCFLANLLGTPAGVVPVTRVRPGEETDRAPSREIGQRTARQVEAGSAGLPVGVQVLALHWHEDHVLAIMRTIERAVRQRPDYPARPPLD